MRKLTPVHVAASVAIAIAGTSVFAQATRPNAGTTNATITSAPRIGAGLNTTTRSGTGTFPTDSAVFKPSETTGTDVRNTQNLQATEGTRSSGSSPTSPTTASTGTGSAAGSSGTNGTGTVTNPGTGTDSSGTDTGTGTNVVTAPLLFNGVIGSDLGTSDAVVDNSGTSNGNAQISANGISAGASTNDTVRSTANLDRVIKQAERDRRKIGRNGQLLYSIAPRTNVDRSNEMPDDGPTPALKGLTSR